MKIAMKTLSAGLLTFTLLAAVGCSHSAPETATAPAPTARVEQPKSVSPTAHVVPAQPVATVAKKPIAGEAEGTFSLSVPFESVTLKQGENKSVVIGINRGANFGEQVGIKVSGLPAGVSLESAEPVIEHGSTSETLTLKAASDAALGDFTVKVTGQTASSSADFAKEFKINVVQR
jgi:hypothetical protein